MRYLKLAFAFLVLLTAAALINSAQVDTDVDGSFKRFVADYMASYKTDTRKQMCDCGEGWANQYFEPRTDFSADVRKTGWLSSPMGVLEFTMITHSTAYHKTEAEARTDYNYIQFMEWKHRQMYLLQEGIWLVESCQTFDPVLNKWFDCGDDSGFEEEACSTANSLCYVGE